MANKKHVARLKQGVEAWNQWRRENPKIRPNLSRADLIRASLRGGAQLAGWTRPEREGSPAVSTEGKTTLRRAGTAAPNLRRPRRNWFRRSTALLGSLG
jgi:hypothetical protein